MGKPFTVIRWSQYTELKLRCWAINYKTWEQTQLTAAGNQLKAICPSLIGLVLLSGTAGSNVQAEVLHSTSSPHISPITAVRVGLAGFRAARFCRRALTAVLQVHSSVIMPGFPFCIQACWVERLYFLVIYHWRTGVPPAVRLPRVCRNVPAGRDLNGANRTDQQKTFLV